MTTNSKLRALLKHITFMKMTESVAGMSYDPKHQVGSIIVKNDLSTIAGLGYNGNYSGGENKRDSDDTGMSGFLHAEENALIKANIEHPENYLLFATMTPCRMCAKRIVNKGIKEVIYKDAYPNADSLDVFRNGGVRVYSIEEKLMILFMNTPYFNEVVGKKERWSQLPLADVAVEMTDLMFRQLAGFFEVNQEPLRRLPAIIIEAGSDLNGMLQQYPYLFGRLLYQMM